MVMISHGTFSPNSFDLTGWLKSTTRLISTFLSSESKLKWPYTKWRILSHPLQFRLKNIGKVLHCCARLHNFCINNWQLPTSVSIEELEKSIQTMYHSTGSAGTIDLGFIPGDNATTNDRNIVARSRISFMREQIVTYIRNNHLVRPAHNLQRRRESSL